MGEVSVNGQPAATWEADGTVGTLTEAGYQVATFDNRGMAGAACPAPPWTMSDMVDDTEAVLEAIGPMAAAVPDGTYVEIPNASHIAIDPASLQVGMDALLPFLAAHS